MQNILKSATKLHDFLTDRYSLPFIRSYTISEIAGQIKVKSFFQGQDCSGKQKFWLGGLVQGKPEVGRKLFLISDLCDGAM